MSFLALKFVRRVHENVRRCTVAGGRMVTLSGPIDGGSDTRSAPLLIRFHERVRRSREALRGRWLPKESERATAAGFAAGKGPSAVPCADGPLLRPKTLLIVHYPCRSCEVPQDVRIKMSAKFGSRRCTNEKASYGKSDKAVRANDRTSGQSVSFVAVTPRSQRLKGRLRSPRSTQVPVLSISISLHAVPGKVGLSSQHTPVT